jgi:hypothetical protein
MALIPNISACLKNKCSDISITDTTGVYNVTDNPGGYGTPNDEGSEVISAILDITLPDGSVVTEDVTSQIPDTVTGDIEFNDISIPNYTDGVISILYTVNAASGTYTYTYTALFTCKARACVDNMWADVACRTCSGSCDLADIIDDANLAEGLLRGLESGAVCCDNACITKILNSITRLCNWNDCNC